MRNNIVELMAGPLTPLFGTFGRATINTSLNRQLSAFFGRSGIMPEEIIILVNGYAYMDGSLSAAQIVRLLAGSVGTAKRMFTGAVERWTGEGCPRYTATVERWRTSAWRELPAAELLAAARQLMEATIDAYGALVSGVIPAAWISEALFTSAYNLLITRRGDPPAPTFLLGFDSTPILAEKALYDLAQWVRTRPGLSGYLMETPAPLILRRAFGNDRIPPEVDAGDWREWQDRFQAHLGSLRPHHLQPGFRQPGAGGRSCAVARNLPALREGRGSRSARPAAGGRSESRACHPGHVSRLKGLRLRLFRKLLASPNATRRCAKMGWPPSAWLTPLLRQMLLRTGSPLRGWRDDRGAR